MFKDPSIKKIVPLLNLKLQTRILSEEIMSAIHNVLENQQFILGPEVKEFEAAIAAYCQCHSAIGCASGSDALLLALMAIGIGEGDEVITTPYSFFATVSSIVRLGAKPVFVDIDPVTYNLDTSQLELYISGKTKAIIPIHLFGQCADMAMILQIAGSNRIPIIEDAAQAIGAKHNGLFAGSMGSIGAFSFYPTKNLGGAGDGGILTTQDPNLSDLLFILRSHGAKRKYFHDFVGINSRLDSLQAAILRVKLKYLDDWVEKRRANAANYKELFERTNLLDRGVVILPIERPESFHVYNQFVIRVQDRDQLREHLTKCKIGTEIYYPLPLHLQPCFKQFGYKEGDMPESERAAKESLAIPIFPELQYEEQEYVVQSINDFYKS